ncbi:ankyrin repeat domain-containing protein [Mycolicibacterium elephantis]
MVSYWELRGEAAVWPGTLNRSLLIESQVQAGHYLADMADKGNWNQVKRQLDPENHLVDVKQWRPGDETWSTVLHQAARQGAPADVIAWLLKRGALKSQRDADGRTAFDIAVAEDQSQECLEILRPTTSPLSPERIDALEVQLGAVIDALIQGMFAGDDLSRLFRFPPVGVLHELSPPELWFQVPLMMGGVRVVLCRGYLEVLAGRRVPTNSGEMRVDIRRYVVTHKGSINVYDGDLVSS